MLDYLPMANPPPILDYAAPTAQKPWADRIASYAVIVLVVVNVLVFGFLLLLLLAFLFSFWIPSMGPSGL